MARRKAKRPRRATTRARGAGPWLDRFGLGTVWLLVVVGPLVVLPTAEDAFRFPKAFAAESLALLSIALLAGRERRSPGAGVQGSPAPGIAGLLLAGAAFSGFFTRHPEHFLEAFGALLVALGAFVAWSRWLRPQEVRRLLDWQLAPAVILSLGVALQFAGLPLFEFSGGIRERLTWTSWAGSAFDLSAWLVLPILHTQVLLTEARGRRRALLVAALALFGGAVLITQTISAVAVVLVASFWVWRGRLPARRVAVAALLAIAVGVVAIAPARERLHRKAEDLASGEWNAVLTGRLDGWSTAWRMFTESPWTGVGHGAYRAEFGAVKSELVREGTRFFARQTQPYFVNAHSEPLEVLAEWGLVGALLALWAVGLVVRRLVAGPLPRELERTARGAWIALGLLALANFPFRLALVAYPALLSLAGALGRGEKEQSEPEPPARARWVSPAVGLLVFACFLVHARRGLEEVRAQRVLFGARALIEAGAGAPAPLAEQALEYLREGAASAPWDVRFEASRGDLFLVLGRPHAAIRSYRDALALEPRPEVRANLGLALIAIGERENAVAQFREALLVDPLLAPRLVAVAPELDPGWGRELPGPDGLEAARRTLDEPASGPAIFGDGFESGDPSAWNAGSER